MDFVDVATKGLRPRCICMGMTKTNLATKPRKDIRQDLADALISHIEAGTAPWQRPWDPAAGDDTPVNAVTHKHYRGINQFWLGLNQPDSDPRWCTFRQAQEKNWRIRKGSHGISVEKWMVLESSKDLEVDGDEATLKEKRLVVRYYTVFHASQIEGMSELVRPELSEASPEPDPRVTGIVSGMGATLSIGGTQAYYRPSADVIRIPALTSFATAADYGTVLLHEIGHATGHKERLKRDLNHLFGSADYAKEELRAEISAAMSARVLGVAFDPAQVDRTERSGLDNSAAYLTGWLSALPEDQRKPELMAAISSAQKISDYVLGFALARPEELEAESELAVVPEPKPEPKVLVPSGPRFRL